MKQRFRNAVPWLRGFARHIGRVLVALGHRRIRPAAPQFFQLLFGVRPILGVFYETRRPKEALEDYLDAIYVREGRENYWAPAYGSSDDIQNLRVTGKVAVIGKGPDLDLIRPEHLAEFDAIFCINDSVHAIERLGVALPVFAVQTDSNLKDRCSPARGRLIVALCTAHNYNNLEADKYVFRLDNYDIERVCTAGYAIAIARKAGANSFVLFAFNAITSGNFDYATAIGGQPADTTYWHLHRAVMEKAAGGAPMDWRKLT